MNRLGRYEFMKGDKDLLEGRVLGYVEADHLISVSQYPGMYASININDLQPYLKEMAMLCEGHGFFYKSQFIWREESTFFGVTCFLDGLEAIADVSGDVLYIGKENDSYKAAQRNIQGVEIYMQEYFSQIALSENAGDFHGRRFVRRFWDYLKELRNSIIRRDNHEKEKNVARIKRFMRDSAFVDNLPYLIQYLERNPDNVGALDLFVEVAQAFHDSDVLNIVPIWGKFKKLSDSSTTIHL